MPPGILNIELKIDLCDAEISDFLLARDVGYARLAYATSTRIPPNLTPSMLPTAPQSESPPPTLTTPSSTPIPRGPSPSAKVPRAGTSRSMSAHVDIVTEEEGTVTLTPTPHNGRVWFLTMKAVPGDWSDRPNKRKPYRRLAVDTGATGTWFYWKDYTVTGRDTKNDHEYDKWQSERVPNLNTSHPEGAQYVDGSTYEYVPVVAPLTIATRGGPIEIPRFKYRLATAVSEELDNYTDVDGFVGFKAQSYTAKYKGEKHANKDSSSHSLVNQLLGAGLISHEAKTFVISPAFEKNVDPQLWVGVDDWPEEVEKDHEILARYYGTAFKIAEAVLVIPTVPRVHGELVSGWAVRLKAIKAWNTALSEVEEVLWEDPDQGVYTILDLGAELAYLPDAFFDTVIRKGSCVHASKVEGTVNDPRPTYLFDQGSVRRDLALQLCFSLRNGRFGCLNVAPIRDAMHFRRCRDQGNRFFLAAHPASALPDLKEGTALIGLNWLKYMRQSYRDRLPGETFIALASGYRF
ncbi:hypothetical protein EV715DRAFT_296901 [Schizophyllum commune]